jgi:hypothetical protein
MAPEEGHGGPGASDNGLRSMLQAKLSVPFCSLGAPQPASPLSSGVLG